MKKIITAIIGLTLIAPTFVNASEFVISNSNSNYNVGDTITVNVNVNPQTNKNYTAILDAKFSTSTLEFVSFTMNNKMLALRQPGYDFADNNSGTLIKTGGYTGGISTESSFGTIIFRAKQEGVGTITINDSSKILDENNVDRQNGSKTISFNIETALVGDNEYLGYEEIITPVISSTSTEEVVNILNDKKSESKNNLIWFAILLLIIIVVAGVNYLIKKRKEI